jgi:hypothetical protein
VGMGFRCYVLKIFSQEAYRPFCSALRVGV